MYNTIKDCKTGKFEKINSKKGKEILKKYLNYVKINQMGKGVIAIDQIPDDEAFKYLIDSVGNKNLPRFQFYEKNLEIGKGGYKIVYLNKKKQKVIAIEKDDKNGKNLNQNAHFFLIRKLSRLKNLPDEFKDYLALPDRISKVFWINDIDTIKGYKSYIPFFNWHYYRVSEMNFCKGRNLEEYLSNDKSDSKIKNIDKKIIINTMIMFLKLIKKLHDNYFFCLDIKSLNIFCECDNIIKFKIGDVDGFNYAGLIPEKDRIKVMYSDNVDLIQNFKYKQNKLGSCVYSPIESPIGTHNYLNKDYEFWNDNDIEIKYGGVNSDWYSILKVIYVFFLTKFKKDYRITHSKMAYYSILRNSEQGGIFDTIKNEKGAYLINDNYVFYFLDNISTIKSTINSFNKITKIKYYQKFYEKKFNLENLDDCLELVFSLKVNNNSIYKAFSSQIKNKQKFVIDDGIFYSKIQSNLLNHSLKINNKNNKYYNFYKEFITCLIYVVEQKIHDKNHDFYWNKDKSSNGDDIFYKKAIKKLINAINEI